MSAFPVLDVDPSALTPPTIMVSRLSADFQSHLQRIFDRPSPVPRIFDDEPPFDPIMKAVEQNDKDGIVQILKKRKKGPFPLLTDEKNWTALHLAASKPEYKECLELLLECAGHKILVNKDGLTFLGETALHIACEHGCAENVLLLLQNGCDAGRKTRAGNSALHIAVSKGHVKMVRYLLDYSANIDAKDENGCTSLHLAAKAGHSDISGMLLANGATVRCVDNEGNLPLHMACQWGTFETACLLVEQDSASLNVKNSEGVTPFMLAISNFDVHGLRYLLENGATTDVCDNSGRMAVHFADSLQDIDIFSLLIQSTSGSYAEQCCASTTVKVLNKEKSPEYTFESYTCSAIKMGADYVDVLMNSHLPKSVLQMPSLHRGVFDDNPTVFSPLAFLFYYCVVSKKITAFEQCLDLLLKHNITMIDEFQRVLGRTWPNYGIRFMNPLSLLISSLWPNDNREHYFNLLIANGVTTDYCLQCYHNNDTPFASFNKYTVYYGPVIYAIEHDNIEVVKLLVANSVILEPDILCNYLIMAYTKRVWGPSLSGKEGACRLYEYLTSLKPIYYKWRHPMFLFYAYPLLPAAEKFSDEALSNFYTVAWYHFQMSPFFASAHHIDTPWPHRFPLISEFSQFPYVSERVELARVTLQQLCRTTIRHHLRETTVEGNLRNFRRKVEELPLPKLLQDYLLFKI